jgi:type II secretory pathway pseudopilin PulG
VSALRSRLESARDGGTTLVELLVTMILMGVVSSLVVAAVVQSTRILTHTQDEETGLNDAKVVFDRIARDVRESRGVVCDGGLADPADPTPGLDKFCTAHLQLWIDSNSDYVEEPNEVVTWRLEWDPDGVHHDVWRIQGAQGTPQTKHLQASSLIVNAVFKYTDASGVTFDNRDPAPAQRVNVELTYDAVVGRGAAPRSAEFEARLRNKG